MFRYVAFSCQPSSESQTSLVRTIQARFLENSAWSHVFESATLHVYATGCTAGINEAYALPSRRGVVLGRLFRRHDVDIKTNRQLAITTHEDARIVETNGGALIEQFWGRWIAFLPTGKGGSHVLRDPSGALPCYQLESGGVSIVFSWLEDVLSLLRMRPPPVSWDAVRATLVFRRLGGRETALEGVTQVLPGELTAMESSGQSPTVLWSAADVARHPLATEAGQAARMLRETTTQFVHAWMSCYNDIVLRLSGGVDSAILLGTLAAAPATANIACLNYHSPGSDSDERRYARLAAARACCRLIERHRDDDFHLRDVLRPARTPAPANHIGRMGSDRMDAETADAVGAPVLFTGAGGDQSFLELRCTWPAADYLQLRGPDRGFLGAVLDAARLGHVSFWRSLQLAFRDRLAKRDPLAGVGENITLMSAESIASALRQADRFVHPALLAASDLPPGKLFQLGALICPVGYYNPFAPHSSPEQVHPLLSQPLQELCLSLPTFLLTRGGRGRALAREAFADRIPREIAGRTSKGGIEDHVTAVLQRSLPLAREVLLDGLLVRSGLLDRDQVDAALSARPSARGTYVTEAHTCFAIEAWLSQVSGTSHAAVE